MDGERGKKWRSGSEVEEAEERGTYSFTGVVGRIRSGRVCDSLLASGDDDRGGRILRVAQSGVK
jgi:hypothetical protein